MLKVHFAQSQTEYRTSDWHGTECSDKAKKIMRQEEKCDFVLKNIYY